VKNRPVTILLLTVFVLSIATLGMYAWTRDTSVTYPAFYWPGWTLWHGRLDDLYNREAEAAVTVNLKGDDPGKPYPFVYAPVFVYFHAPFALLPYDLSLRVWNMAQLAVTLSVLWVFVSRKLPVPGDRLLAMLPVLLSYSLAYNIRAGQSSGFWLVLILLGLMSENGIWRGLWFALAVAMKPVALIMLAPYWRERRMWLGFGVGILVSVLAVGGGTALAYLQAFPVFIANNYHGLWYIPSLAEILRHNLWLYLVVALPWLALTAWDVYCKHPEALSLVVLCGLALAPIVEIHHELLLIVPLVAAVKHRRWLGWSALSLVLVYVSWEHYVSLSWMFPLAMVVLWWQIRRLSIRTIQLAEYV